MRRLASPPPLLAIVAFSLCSVIFLPIAVAKSPDSFRTLRGRLRQLLWVNVTTGLAWVSFFHALRTTEPMLVQILFAGVRPLTVVWVDRLAAGHPRRSSAGGERRARLALSVALVGAVVVALAGLSGVGPQPLGTAALNPVEGRAEATGSTGVLVLGLLPRNSSSTSGMRSS